MHVPRELLDFAVDLAWEAGKITLAYFQTGVAVETKADLSPVTIADRRAEEAMRARIAARFPDHAIVGEEMGESAGRDRSHRWILDPIDGTASFVRGVPLYGVMVGLEIEGRAAVGVVNCPAIGDVVWAATGHGASWNGRRARVSEVSRMSDALLLATDAGAMARYGRQDAYARLCAATARQRTWGDCYGHLLVATGRAEVMLDPRMNLWDCAALRPILEEAGGTFTDWSGRATHEANEAIATNGLVKDEVFAIIRAGQQG